MNKTEFLSDLNKYTATVHLQNLRNITKVKNRDGILSGIFYAYKRKSDPLGFLRTITNLMGEELDNIDYQIKDLYSRAHLTKKDQKIRVQLIDAFKTVHDIFEILKSDERMGNLNLDSSESDRLSKQLGSIYVYYKYTMVKVEDRLENLKKLNEASYIEASLKNCPVPFASVKDFMKDPSGKRDFQIDSREVQTKNSVTDTQYSVPSVEEWVSKTRKTIDIIRQQLYCSNQNRISYGWTDPGDKKALINIRDEARKILKTLNLSDQFIRKLDSSKDIQLIVQYGRVKWALHSLEDLANYYSWSVNEIHDQDPDEMDKAIKENFVDFANAFTIFRRMLAQAQPTKQELKLLSQDDPFSWIRNSVESRDKWEFDRLSDWEERSKLIEDCLHEHAFDNFTAQTIHKNARSIFATLSLFCDRWMKFTTYTPEKKQKLTEHLMNAMKAVSWLYYPGDFAKLPSKSGFLEEYQKFKKSLAFIKVILNVDKILHKNVYLV